MEKKISLSLYQCALCTLKFSFDKIKYSKDGKKIICVDCYNKIMKKEQKAQTDDHKQNFETKLRSSQPREGGIKVMCANCSYKFTYKPKPQLKPKCPYCGKGNIRKYEELTAEKLINEVSNIDFERSNRRNIR